MKVSYLGRGTLGIVVLSIAVVLGMATTTGLLWAQGLYGSSSAQSGGQFIQVDYHGDHGGGNGDHGGDGGDHGGDGGDHGGGNGSSSGSSSGSSDISQTPLFLTHPVAPIVMLTLSNDEQLYYNAFPEYADLNGDGKADKTYINDFTYYGYFDPGKCYSYDGSKFVPQYLTSDHYCTQSTGQWSGNFLNWIAMARIDIVRKILYGGYRSTDTSNETVLERTYLPNDTHSWVRYYDGSDIDKLTPFTAASSSSAVVRSNDHTVGTGSVEFYINSTTGSTPQLGDQVVLTDANGGNAKLEGVITDYSSGGYDRSPKYTIQVTESNNVRSHKKWNLTDSTRAGVSFCNTTVAGSNRYSEDVTAPPLIRAAQGDYSLWAANERWQCRWFEEKSYTGHPSIKSKFGVAFSNGNDIAITGLDANAGNPRKNDVGLGDKDYIARVQACVPGLIGTEKCKTYPDGDSKPIGVLQEYGDNGQIDFGMVTGSYTKNKSGGVLRKNAGPITDEINESTDGTFKTPTNDEGIIYTLNKFRLYGYDTNNGYYNTGGSSGDDCPWALSSFNNGQCTNWGNPQSEMYLETLRYLAGKKANNNFTFSGDDKIPGLKIASWKDPLDSANYCTPLDVIDFNASVNSYDSDELQNTSDIGAGSASSLTDTVGQGEGIDGKQWLVGETSSNSNQLCTAKQVDNFGTVLGICPEAPRLAGSYDIAGLAHYAYTNSIRKDLPGEQIVKTYGVDLAPAVPRIEIPQPGGTTPAVTILPACRDTSLNPAGNCSITGFQVISQDTQNGTGSFLIIWDDSEQGGDHDSDMKGILSYSISGSSIQVTTQTFAESTPYAMGFGYVISGTTDDGFHVSSGIHDFTYSDPSGGADCHHRCKLTDAASSRSYTLGNSPAGLLKSPLYYAAKWGGYVKSAGFPDTQSSWDGNGDGIPDNYYYAVDPAKLASDLAKLFRGVATIAGSVASVAANSAVFNDNNLIYQAGFNSTDWSGDLLAYKVLANGFAGPLQWNAATELDQAYGQNPSGRDLVTWRPDKSKGVAFAWNSLSQSQRAALGSQSLLAFIAGSHANEQQNGGSYRNRTTLLGDIIDSNPVFSHKEDFGDALLPGSEGSSYGAFLQSKANRTPMIYVGANDGMLHGFNADTGAEAFGYIPNALMAKLPELASPAYDKNHQFYVDGNTTVADAYIATGNGSAAWHTVLVGALGAGGSAIYALDVTDPSNFSASDVLWEDSNSDTGFADLGATIGQPTIARLNDGTWVAVFGNGYGTDTASLFVVNLATGQLIAEIPVPTTGSNGLASPTTYDLTGDLNTDLVYAGDLQGHLWRFDISDTKPKKWGVSLLFTATDGTGSNAKAQPITVRPAAEPALNGGQMVYFGTGKYFGTSDGTNMDVQSFYGIWDDGTTTGITRSDLQQQVITDQVAQNGRQLRATTANSVDWTTQKGWYIDLLPPSGTAQGERVVDNPQLNQGRILFATLIPATNPCDYKNSGWLMALDAGSGGRNDQPVFDLNGDGTFDNSDKVQAKTSLGADKPSLTAPSGLSFDHLIRLPGTTLLDQGQQFVPLPGVNAGDRLTAISNKPGAVGRQSWEQLQ